jgi:ankyrin repeat protein
MSLAMPANAMSPPSCSGFGHVQQQLAESDSRKGSIATRPVVVNGVSCVEVRRDDDGYTLLMEAAAKGQEESVKKLISYGQSCALL